MLMPSTATADKFTVYDEAGNNISVNKLLYDPYNNQVVLTVTPEEELGRGCEVEIAPTLRYMDGTSASGGAMIQSEIALDYECDVYDLSVKRVKLYNNSGGVISAPSENVPFVVKVVFANGSNMSLTKQLKIYKNKMEKIFIDEEITVPACSTLEKSYNIGAGAWSGDDVLKVKLFDKKVQ